jgi:hypothetical protein
MVLFANGSFETGSWPDIDNWTLGGDATTIEHSQIHVALTSDGGSWSLYLKAGNGSSYASQTFTNTGVSGFVFDYKFQNTISGIQDLKITINGSYEFSIPPADLLTHHYIFNRGSLFNSDITSIMFEARDPWDEAALEVYIDGVVITANPDPTLINLTGIQDISGLDHPVALTGIQDIAGITHAVDLQGITTASHGVASTFRCDIN